MSNANGKQRSEERRAWQEVVIHKYLTRVGKTGAQLDAIIMHYRSEASARPKQLKKAHLTEDECRRVLISLVSKRVVHQLGDDSFRVANVSASSDTVLDDLRQNIIPNILSTMGLHDALMGDVSIKRAVYSILSNAPDQLTVSDIALKVV